MIKYKLNDYLLELKRDKIRISKSGELIDEFSLICDSNKIAKINIPLSTRCNMKCLYCIENHLEENTKVINLEFAKQAIYSFIKYISTRKIKIAQLSFDYGGEPVLELDLLMKLSKYFRDCCKSDNIKSIVQVTSNGTWDNETSLLLFNSIDEIIVSFDILKELQSRRILKSNEDSYELVLNNIKKAYQYGKLKQINCVIDKYSLSKYEEISKELQRNYKNIKVKLSPIIVQGSAKLNNFSKVNNIEWKDFISKLKVCLTNKNIEIIDAHPQKILDKKYFYGCEHLEIPNWFCWFNNTITSCSDRKKNGYCIGNFKDKLYIDYCKIENIVNNYNVNNIEYCNKCIAKYYCAGYCPSARKDGIVNCKNRQKRYAKLIMERYLHDYQ